MAHLMMMGGVQQKTLGGYLLKFTFVRAVGLFSLNGKLIIMYQEHTALEVWNPSL